MFKLHSHLWFLAEITFIGNVWAYFKSKRPFYIFDFRNVHGHKPSTFSEIVQFDLSRLNTSVDPLDFTMALTHMIWPISKSDLPKNAWICNQDIAFFQIKLNSFPFWRICSKMIDILTFWPKTPFKTANFWNESLPN